MKLQYKSEPLEIKSENRYLLYRIDPSELSWWKRTFKNPWKYAFRAYKPYKSMFFSDKGPDDCLSFLFTAREAHEFVEKYDTYEELIDFLTAEYNRAKVNYYMAQKNYKQDRWDF